MKTVCHNIDFINIDPNQQTRTAGQNENTRPNTSCSLVYTFLIDLPAPLTKTQKHTLYMHWTEQKGYPGFEPGFINFQYHNIAAKTCIQTRCISE